MYSAVRSREASIPDAYSNKYEIQIVDNLIQILMKGSFVIGRIVKEGIMEPEDIKNLLASNNAVLSKAFQEAEVFTPSPTETFSQVGDAQSKLSPKVRTFRFGNEMKIDRLSEGSMIISVRFR